MGSSPTAKIAWAIDLGDADNDEDAFDWDASDTDEHEFESEIMPGLFGFTEEAPERPAGLTREEGHAWWEANRKPYNERHEAAVPLAFASYGYEFAGSALVLKRSLHDVDWGCMVVDPARLTAPTAEELAAFAKVTEHLGAGDRPVSLLLMAMYG